MQPTTQVGLPNATHFKRQGVAFATVPRQLQTLHPLAARLSKTTGPSENRQRGLISDVRPKPPFRCVHSFWMAASKLSETPMCSALFPGSTAVTVLSAAHTTTRMDVKRILIFSVDELLAKVSEDGESSRLNRPRICTPRTVPCALRFRASRRESDYYVLPDIPTTDESS